MLTGLPYPYKLRVVATAAVLVDRKLRQRAKASPILLTPSTRLWPTCTVEASPHSSRRAAAHTVCAVEHPSKLGAAEGSAEGAPLGVDDGLALGAAEGSADGLDEGSAVGGSVGAYVGALLGALEGGVEGALLGALLGAGDD